MSLSLISSDKPNDMKNDKLTDNTTSNKSSDHKLSEQSIHKSSDFRSDSMKSDKNVNVRSNQIKSNGKSSGQKLSDHNSIENDMKNVNSSKDKGNANVNSNDKLKKCYIQIKGMTCASCVSTIENHLLHHNGPDGPINSALIALMAQKGEIIYHSELITPQQIASIITNLGYDSTVLNCHQDYHEIAFEIMGIDDDNCIKLKQKLKIPGINSVTFDQNLIKVMYDSELIGPREINDVINSNGFTATPINNIIDPLNHDLYLKNEIKKWKRSFFFSLIFGVPTMFTMLYFMYILPLYARDDNDGQEGHEDGHSKYLIVSGLSLENLILFLLATPVQFIGGKHFYIQAYKSLKHANVNMDLLIIMATSIAYFYSVCVLIYFMLIQADQSPITFFDTPPMLLVFIALGRWLECLAKRKTSESLAQLMSLQVS